MSSVRADHHQKLLEEALQPAGVTMATDDQPPAASWRQTLRLLRGPQRMRSVNGLSVFYRSLAALFSSGIKLARGMEILSKQDEEPALAEILPRVVATIWEGSQLSKALSPYPWIFSPLHIRLIEIGEATGKLGKVLTQIAEYEEKRTALQLKVKSAMSYPAFLFAFSMLIVIFAPPYMFGGLFKFIEQSHGEIPPLTKVMLSFSAFVTSRWFFLFLAVAAYAGLRIQRHMASNLEARRRWMQRLLGVPVIGRTLRIVAVCRFARSLAVTISTGIPIIPGLKMAAESSDNLILVQRIEKACTSLEDGKTLMQALDECDFFPVAFVQIVRVGEETGQVGDVVKSMADLYEVEMDEALNQMLAMLEPIWMLIMGIMIGFLAIATMLPMMAMLQHI